MHTYDNHFRATRSLITGGAGFIGSHIAHRLISLGGEVRVLDDLSGGYRENVPDGAELIEASILDDAALREAMNGCRYVFHEAAMVSVPQSVEEPGKCVEINIVGTQRVLEAARDLYVSRVMFAGSAAAYGATPMLPSCESHAPDCWSPYAASKVAGEQLLAAHGRTQGLSTVSLRYFNIFGPRQDPNSPYAAVISAFSKVLLEGKQPSVFGDGTQTRDFTSIENVVHANLLAAASPRNLAGEIINIGTGRRISLLDVLAVMGDELGMKVEPTFGPPRPGDVPHSQASITVAREILGYEPVVTFEEGMKRLLASLRR